MTPDLVGTLTDALAEAFAANADADKAAGARAYMRDQSPSTASSEREFFIRKAIGWALREYSKTDEAAMRAFVAKHTDRLAPLSRKEALRRLERRF